MAIREVTPEEYKQILRTKPKVAVDFGAGEWSWPSQMMYAKFKKYSEEYPGITCLHIDTDYYPEFADSQGVKAVPTFYFFHNGQKISYCIGPDPSMLKRNLDKLNAC